MRRRRSGGSIDSLPTAKSRKIKKRSNEVAMKPLKRAAIKASPWLCGGANRLFLLRADKSEIRDVHVAKNRQEECVMDADSVRDDALDLRDDCAAYDRRDQQA